MARLAVLVFMLLFMGFWRSAHANPCPVIEGGNASLATVDGAVRLEFLRSRMRFAARQSRIWAWSSAGVLLAVGNFQILGATHVPDPGDRIDLSVGVASLGFSLLQLAVVPPRIMFDQWTLDRHVARAPPNADRCALLAEAERFLVRDARSEVIGRSPAMHAVTLLFNIGVGLLLGIGFDRWTSAAVNMFLGSGLGELQILTEPTESVALLDRYRAGDLGPRKQAQTGVHWQLAPSLERQGLGLAFALSY